MIVILLQLIVTGFLPGWFVVRHARWSPVEQLTGAVALSLVLVFAVRFIGYWTHLPVLPTDAAIVGVSVLLGAAGLRDLRRFWHRRIVRHAVWALAALVTWSLLLLALLHSYGGGNSCCDWLEHYQRTRNFIERLPLDYRYIDRFDFFARPPLLNVLAAHLIGWRDGAFADYQVACTMLNLLGFLAALTLSRLFTSSGRPVSPWLLALVFGANPMFFNSTVMPWTKVLSAFFILYGMAMAATGCRRTDVPRLAMAMGALAAAVVTHYSALPYAAVTALFALTGLLGSRRPDWFAVGTIALPAVLVGGLWFGYVAMTAGVKVGLIANPTMLGTEEHSLRAQVQTRTLNLRDTFIPIIYTGYNSYPEDVTPTRWWADQIFSWYQNNAILAIGSLAGLLAIGRAAHRLRESRSRERWFWAVAPLTAAVIGILLHGDRETSGVGVVAVQPLVYLALSFLAAEVPNCSLWWRRVWLVGLVIDLTLGVGLEVWFQSSQSGWSATPNWHLKSDASLVFLGDTVARPEWVVSAAATIGLMSLTWAWRNYAKSPSS